MAATHTDTASEGEFLEDEGRIAALEDDLRAERAADAAEAVIVRDDEKPLPPAVPMSVWDMPAEQFKAALDNRKANRAALIDYVSSHLTQAGENKDGDYWVIRGKKVLAKAGAEKILSLLGLTAHFPSLAEYERAALEGKPINNIVLACEIRKADGAVVAHGGGIGRAGEFGNDLNKMLKMTRKRALIDATLGLGLSVLYTQDIEEKQAEARAAPPKKPARKPAAKKSAPPKKQSAPAPKADDFPKARAAIKRWLDVNEMDMPRNEKLRTDWGIAAAQALSPDFVANKNPTKEAAMEVLEVFEVQDRNAVFDALTEAAEFVGIIRQPGADEGEGA